MKFETVEKLVFYILERDEKARNSDMHLWLRACEIVGEQKGVHVDSMSVIRFFVETKKIGLPQYETVSRCRRKIQSLYPALASERKIAKERRENEEKFKEYARS